MKTRILSIMFMTGILMGAYAQKETMTLTFTADNNGVRVPLNSILIENLTRGGDTMLFAPDTVLVLDYILGMNENTGSGDNSFFLAQNYPNPMKGKTTVSLCLPEKEEVLVTVSDVTGRKVVNKAFHLERGSHSFTFYSGRESLYFLTARTDLQSRTIKMFNSPSGANAAGYCKLEYNGLQHAGTGDVKSGNAPNNFVFDLGDQLKFTASTSLGERVITSSPTGGQTYYFHYTGNPCPGTPTVTDFDGNVYNTVLIGSQCWMKENLKTTSYRNGTPVPNETDGAAWSELVTGAYAWYENDISWKDSYGALYNWYATVDADSLCPTGWRVPTHEDWSALATAIGGEVNTRGDMLKSCRQVNTPLGGSCNTNEHPRWEENVNDDHHGTDDFGFTAFPGGIRYDSGPFYVPGYYGYWWTSTESSWIEARSRSLDYHLGYLNEYSNSLKRDGFSVRCIRDY
jgi:uncharacterized protein (TIGR02145 family)